MANEALPFIPAVYLRFGTTQPDTAFFFLPFLPLWVDFTNKRAAQTPLTLFGDLNYDLEIWQ
jgi:hypothetical protein